MKISFNPSNSNKNILDLIKNNKDIIFDLKEHSIFARGVEFKGTDTNTWRDIKINNVSIGSHTLDLRNGSNTTLTNTNGVVTINSTWRPVVDNLTSDSTTSSLSAKQGKVLKALIDGKSNSAHNHDGRYVRYYAVTTLDCNNLAAGLTAASISATNAAHANHSAYLYISDVGTPFQIQIPDSSIPYIYKRYYGSGKWSEWFKLSAGYADSAGSVAWANVTDKPSAFDPAAHTHTVFKNNLMIKGPNGISDSASIHLGIGDFDTGFKWISDGVCQIYANNAAVGQWTSGGMDWFKNPTVNGNKVWNAGNDGSGSGLDADTLDGYHAASFVKMRQFRFTQYKEGFWTKILTITINSTSDLQPVIAFNWIPSECAREVWAEFTINWRSNSPIFYAIWKGTAVRTLTCVNSSGNIWDVWVQGDKNSYDPFGEIQVTYTYNISSYNGGSLGYSDSDPGGTRCTLGGYVNYADSAGSVAWANVTDKPSAFDPAAHTHTVFKNNLMIKGPNGISDSASIHLGIGDFDTGFKWISDGVCQIYANNAAVGQWTSGGMDWFKNPTVNGNKVWNAGNDGSGSGLDADTLDGYHASAFSYKSWWHWYGKDGQPNWLWGGNNENDYYVYNPSNFRVAYAASAGNADTVDGEHASNFSYTHQTSFDFRKSKSGRIVTFDQSNTNYGWINGFASTHNNYLTSVIFNSHRTSDWYVGYMEGNRSTGETKGLQAVHKLAFADGDGSYPIFLGYLDLYNGNDGTISSSFPCLGYSVPFTYTRGGTYCTINIPDTSFQTFFIKAAIASVHHSGGGMGHLVGNHRSDGAWWLHCEAVGSNTVQVKGFHPANQHNDSWWGGNPLYSSDGAAKVITVFLFGHVIYK